MNTIQFVICLCGLAGFIALALRAAYWYGITTGRDLQRVDDIQELWAHMPDRDAKGRFTKRNK